MAKAAKATAKVFVVDCHICKAKVAAEETGRAERVYSDCDGDPIGERLFVGKCPSCKSILAGFSNQLEFEGYTAEQDEWGSIIRVFPKPPKEFASTQIPRTVRDSFNEADRSLQANANTAACVMFGRALEALCRDVLARGTPSTEKRGTLERPVTLATGLEKLKELRVIDERLYAWSQKLRAFRNMAAHPTDAAISREDAEDLQSFASAIIEYVYDLTER